MNTRHLTRTFGAVITLMLFCGGITRAAGPEGSPPGDIPLPDIPFTRFVLTNGLTLLVHEDHKAAIVGVNVWYHVGSKNEPPGRTGFAHLFEHLMFNGSEHFNDDYFKAMEMVGATDLNGTTSEDRTDYFENAPKNALDFLLWMESDRMGYLLGAIDQAKLDEQRGVVQNEKRQYENQPYGLAEELITKGTYPPEHPYGHTVIGSMEDLNAAALEDVKDWFRKYYGAANATLVVAGDVETSAVKEKVEKYFGSIPSGPPVTRHETWIAKRAGTRRQIAQDRVPLARIYKVWNVTRYGMATTDYLNLASDVLGSGKSSRLYQRLVYRDQIATEVSAYVEQNEIGGRFGIVATARPDVPLATVEKAIDEELQKFLDEGPTQEELQRVATQFVAEFTRRVERIGGFGGKSDILALNQVFMGRPDYYKVVLDHVRKATPKDVHAAAREWLADGAYILEVHPFPNFQVAGTQVDRSKLPVPELHPEVKFPELQHATLPNGLKLVVAERHALPLVNMALQVDAGFAADQFALPGTAELTLSLLDEGTKTRTSPQISDALARLGAEISTDSDLDTSTVYLSALKANLDKALDIFADIIQNPIFPEADFNRLKNQQLDAIQREKSEPAAMALRVMPKLLYGEGHAYSTPLTGSGTRQSVTQITRARVQDFYRNFFKPNNATLIVVGDTSMQEIKPKLERLFDNWSKGEVPKKNLREVKTAGESVVYLIDRPGSLQSMIFCGQLAPPKNNPDETAIETMNFILGGTFTSRLNMNLREDKHWSYGVRSMLVPARGQRPLMVVAPVQADKTKEAMSEIAKELQGIVGKQPVTEKELAKAQKDRTLRLVGTWETGAQVAKSTAELVRFNLPDDYYKTLPEKVLALKTADLENAAEKVVHPKNLIWVVVGDRAKIELDVASLGLGKVQVLSAEP